MDCLLHKRLVPVGIFRFISVRFILVFLLFLFRLCSVLLFSVLALLVLVLFVIVILFLLLLLFYSCSILVLLFMHYGYDSIQAYTKARYAKEWLQAFDITLYYTNSTLSLNLASNGCIAYN